MEVRWRKEGDFYHAFEAGSTTAICGLEAEACFNATRKRGPAGKECGKCLYRLHQLHRLEYKEVNMEHGEYTLNDAGKPGGCYAPASLWLF